MKSIRRYLLILLIIAVVGISMLAVYSYNKDGEVNKVNIIKSFNENSKVFSEVAEYISEVEGDFTIYKKDGKYRIYAKQEYLNFDNCPVKDQIIFILNTLKYQRIEKEMSPKAIVFYRYFGEVNLGLMFLKGDYCSVEKENFYPQFIKLKDEWYYFCLPHN